MLRKPVWQYGSSVFVPPPSRLHPGKLPACCTTAVLCILDALGIEVELYNFDRYFIPFCPTR